MDQPPTPLFLKPSCSGPTNKIPVKKKSHSKFFTLASSPGSPFLSPRSAKIGGNEVLNATLVVKTNPWDAPATVPDRKGTQKSSLFRSIANKEKIAIQEDEMPKISSPMVRKFKKSAF